MYAVNDAPTRRADAAVLHPLRVFLVEDSEVILDRLIESVASLPHVCVVGHADTEAGALAALQKTPCDVVVLDLRLRDGNGVRAGWRLRL